MAKKVALKERDTGEVMFPVTSADQVIHKTGTTVQAALEEIATKLNDNDDVVAGLVTTISDKVDSSTLDEYYRKDEADQMRNLLLPKVVHCTETTKQIEANTYYIWGEVEELNITLAPPISNEVLNEYMIEFVSGETPTALTLPETVKFSSFSIKANAQYQVSIINNIGVIYGV